MTGWVVEKDVEIGEYVGRERRQTAGPEGFPHFHTKGKKENMELNWSIIFSPFCGKLLPLIHRIQGVDKGTGGNVDSLFVTVHSSARTRQMSCLHEQMTGSERTKGAPVHEKRWLRSSGERGARLCEWRGVTCGGAVRYLPFCRTSCTNVSYFNR